MPVPATVRRLFFAFLLTVPVGALAQKTDLIVADNGDRTTGDIKELKRGLLEVSTDNMGSVFIDWDSIVSLTTSKYYSIQTHRGERAFGSIETSEDQRSLIVSYQGDSVTVPVEQVFTLARVQESFWKGLDGSVGLGLSAKKAKNAVGLNFNVDVRYLTRREFYQLLINSDLSDRSDSARTERHYLNFSNFTHIVADWYSLAWLEFEQNTELNLRLRSLIAGGASHDFIKNNRSRLAGAFGLDVNREQYFVGFDRLSAEAFLSLSYDYCKLRIPRADVVMRLRVFPSLTETDRIRSTFSTNVSWEITKMSGSMSIFTIRPTAGHLMMRMSTGLKEQPSVRTGGW